MKCPEVPSMTRVGIPKKKPERRELPIIPPLPMKEPSPEEPAPVTPPPVRTPQPVPAGR